MTLCYELSHQEVHTLHQVKVHDVRAFAASKVFVTYIGHYISTLYITYIRHYISALFNLSFMFIHCHKR